MLAFRPCTRCSASSTFRALPETTAEEKEIKVARGEELLAQYAVEGSKQTMVLRHAIGVTINLLGGLLLWLKFDDPEQAISTFVSGAIASELNIWSDPWNSPDELDAYNQLSSGAAQVRFWFTPMPNGLAVNASF